MLSLLVTLVWVALNVTSLVFAKRQRLSSPWSSFRGSFLLIAVEVGIIGIAFQTSVTHSSTYLIVAGSLFLIAGWVVSYQRLLERWLRRLPNISQLVFAVVLGTSRPGMGVHVQSLLGDWFQLVGLTLVWSSPHAFVLALFIIPILPVW